MPTPAPPGMTDGEVDALLAELAAVATTLLTEAADARRRADGWANRSAAHTERGVPASSPVPGRALACARHDIARAATAEAATAARSATAWWADAAAYAVTAVLGGHPVDPLRMAAADPSASFTPEELGALPDASEFDRQLAELAAWMATVPTRVGDGPELVETALRAAQRAGMRVDWAADGGPTAVDSGAPDERRHRIWGARWTDHRLPALASAAEFAALLHDADVPDAAAAGIRAAAEAVDEVVAAAERLRELSTAEPADRPAAAEVQALTRQSERAPVVLAGFAAVLTEHLPAIRRAARLR